MVYARQVVQEMYNGIRTIVTECDDKYYWQLLDRNNVVVGSGRRGYDRLHEALTDSYKIEQEIIEGD